MDFILPADRSARKSLAVQDPQGRASRLLTSQGLYENEGLNATVDVEARHCAPHQSRLIMNQVILGVEWQ